MSVTKQHILKILGESIEKWDKIAAGGSNDSSCSLCEIFIGCTIDDPKTKFYIQCPLSDGYPDGECANWRDWFEANKNGRHDIAMKEAAKLANIIREKRDDILSGKDTRWPDELEKNFIINNGYCRDHSKMDIVIPESGNL